MEIGEMINKASQQLAGATANRDDSTEECEKIDCDSGRENRGNEHGGR